VRCSGQYDEERTRLAAALLLTLRGTPVLYYGEEIGMTNRALDDITQLRDRVAVWMHDYARNELGMSPAEALTYATDATRDRCRTPMQWEPAPNGGFCPPESTPWLPLSANVATGITVADQSGDTDSLLGFYRRLLALRRQTPALQIGDYHALAPDARTCLAFLRSDQSSGQTILVAFNFSPRPKQLALDLAQTTTGRLLLSTEQVRQPEVRPADLVLRPFEVLILELTSANE